ncbi:hypothetical protein [Jannaschia sp. M317]|uniref:hypothetical protein n=1 Tax=Jannaschia sp. M317 TaxID=2867011 RepID=UPI0021A32ABF|nr:hypothetical protein [Jannaschia sp. M317]UWQ19849.1 hypothetical protein K3551_19065 [Jannaschia sp. M317]
MTVNSTIQGENQEEIPKIDLIVELTEEYAANKKKLEDLSSRKTSEIENLYKARSLFALRLKHNAYVRMFTSREKLILAGSGATSLSQKTKMEVRNSILGLQGEALNNEEIICSLIDDLQRQIEKINQRQSDLKDIILEATPFSTDGALAKLEIISELMLDSGGLELDIVSYHIHQCVILLLSSLGGASSSISFEGLLLPDPPCQEIIL